ncbi:hypothetical protein ACFQWH_08040 [Mycolicibacterium sp. GCM10028919]|uniref:hypothetical protein n=1 Tax=Mycolicibacterium sp. GCM10028919 TaxID=3273401 RepID=UPI003607CBD1
MADVTARLAEGMPAVANAGEYVTACCRLGFSGLTSDTIADWYGTEEGLSLAALQSDSDALHAAATAADDAARAQADVTSRLAGAWQGGAGAAAQGFLLGEAAAAESIRDALRTAAIATSTLHDDLACAVDAKVDAALTIDDRVAGRRAEWLDAAGTVQTGAGDVVSASELVDAQVKPFVADDISSELMARLRASFDHVTAAFDAAIARLEACPAPVFGAPAAGAEQPWAAPAAAAPVGASTPAASPPTSAAPTPPAPLAVEPTAPVAAVPAAPVEPPSGLPAGPPAMGGLGGGTPSLGSATSGLSGLGQQLADMIGGLFGGGGAGAGAPGLESPDLEPPDLEPPDLESEDEDLDDEDPEDLEDPDTDDDEPEDEPTAADDSAVTEPTADDLADDSAEGPAEPVADENDSADEAPVEPEPAAEVSAPTPPVPPPAEPEALTVEQTPCEIAAEELPSVGG